MKHPRKHTHIYNGEEEGRERTREGGGEIWRVINNSQHNKQLCQHTVTASLYTNNYWIVLTHSKWINAYFFDTFKVTISVIHTQIKYSPTTYTFGKKGLAKTTSWLNLFN